MPCNQRIMIEQELKNANMTQLKEAVEKATGLVAYRVDEDTLSWSTGSYNRATGILKERSEERAEKIRKTYAFVRAQNVAKVNAGRFASIKVVGEYKFQIISNR